MADPPIAILQRGEVGLAMRPLPEAERAERVRPDAFPHTRRPLPWLLAAFLAMLFFIPVDSTTIKVHLPVGSEPDRFAVVVLIVAWFYLGGDQRAFLRTHRSKLFVGSACVYFAIAVASLLLNAGTVIHLNDLNQIGLNEFTGAEKRLALLGSFMVLSWFTLSALRYVDLAGFASYLIGLAAAMSVGVLIERHTGYNIFYNWSATILKPIATVAPSPTVIHPAFGSDGRVTVVGPTAHGLALTTMLVIVMPFALVRIFDAHTRRTRLINGAAAALMLAAAASTDRKTALLVPAAMVIYLLIYRRRYVKLRYVPVALVTLGLLVHVAAPAALGVLSDPSQTSGSTAHRDGDFTALQPDVMTNLVFGRGFGTIDPDDPQDFRINDNEYLDEVWESGVLGLVAYTWMVLSPIVLARRSIRWADWQRSQLALAASAGCVAFLVVSGLFDALAFPQAPYLFFVTAALTTIAAAGPAPELGTAGAGENARIAAASAVALGPQRSVEL